MADIRLAFKRTPSQIDTIVLDAALSEKHDFQADVTEHPVEEGANITDHVRTKPKAVAIEGIISNTPTSRNQALRAFADGNNVADQALNALSHTAAGQVINTAIDTLMGTVAGYAETAFKQLEKLVDSGTLITIVTKKKTYKNMKVVTVSSTDDAKTGDALKFTMTAREILLVKNKRVILEAVPKTLKKVDKGQKPTSQPKPEKPKSLAKGIADTKWFDTALKKAGIR